jgi:PAS domain S-box-containing protein
MPEGHATVVRELVVPVIRDGKITAILGVGNKPINYDEEDITIVSMFADFAWDIVARKRSEEERENAHLESKRYARELSAYLMGSEYILRGDDFETAVRGIFDIACEMTGAQSGSVTLLSEDGLGSEYLFSEAVDWPCDVDPYQSMPIRDLREQAYKSQRGVYENNIMKGEGGNSMPEGQVYVKNVMFIPLHIEGKAVGIMCLANKPNDFTVDDKRLAEAFGQQAAIAFQNNRSLEIIRKSEDKFRRLVENLGKEYFFYIHNTNGVFSYLSPSIKDMLGHTREEFMAHYSTFLTDNPINKEVEEKTNLTISGIQQPPYLVEIYSKSKDIHWLEVTETPVFDPDGTVIAVEGIAHDITDRKQAEDALQESEKIHRELLNNLNSGVVVHASDTSVVYSNPRACELLSLSEEQILGKVAIDPEWKFLREDGSTMPLEEYPVNQVMDSQKPLRNQVVGIQRNKYADVSWVLVNGFPTFKESGKLDQATITFIDITDRVQAEKELHQYEWLLEKEKLESTEQNASNIYSQVCESPINLNTAQVILDGVGKETLDTMARDILDLMDTTVAVYEANGDYAYGVFKSGWCQFMDKSSFKLCGVSDTKAALDSGKWLCRECAWNESAKPAIDSGKPTDIVCVGGINLYAVPIFAGDEIIGAMNVGYQNPPD